MKKTLDNKIFYFLSYFFTTIAALACLFPFIMMLAGSFSSEHAVMKSGYALWPREFTLNAYTTIFSDPRQIGKSYLITVSITGIGTVLGLLLTAMTAYVLNCKDFFLRNQMSFFFYFTTLFNGGLVAYYLICMRYLHFKNNYIALVLPLLLNAFYIIIMRNFMKSIPDAIMESAKIDGAGDFRIFCLIIPLMKPALASIGMFIALNYWNDWYLAMLFIEEKSMFPLQYMLYRMLSSINFLIYASKFSSVSTVDIPKETIKLAMTVVSIGPILLLYPFVQKFFVKGITIGAVKG